MNSPVRPPKPDQIRQSQTAGPPIIPERRHLARHQQTHTVDTSCIDALTPEDLGELSRYPELIHDLYLSHRLEDYEHLEALQEAQSQAAKTLAMKHEEFNAALRETQTALSSAHQSESNWRIREGEMYASLKPYSQQSLHAALVAAHQEQLQVSEASLQSFLRSPNDVEAFVDEYRGHRERYHRLDHVLARWKEGRVSGFL